MMTMIVIGAVLALAVATVIGVLVVVAVFVTQIIEEHRR